MNKQKLFTLILASAMFLTTIFSSCQKSENDPDNPGVSGTEVVEKTSLLTNVYRGSAFQLPEEYDISDQIAPLYDKETGNTTILAYKYEYQESETDGEYSYTYSFKQHLLTYDKDANLIEDKEFEIKNDAGNSQSIYSGVLSKDSILFVESNFDQNTYEETYYLVKYFFADGSTVKSAELSAMSESGDEWFYINSICTDGDGWVYLNADSEVIVLDETFAKKFSAMSENWIQSMSLSPSDGKVYISTYLDDGYGLLPIDKENGKFGDAIELGRYNINNICFGEGYDLFYADDTGVYGMNFTTESAAESSESDSADPDAELLMSFSNSDIYSSNFDLSLVIDKETFIGQEYNSTNYNRIPAIFKKSPDIDLSQIKVLEIATADGIDYNYGETIIEFNKTHDDTRIVIVDYSTYNNENDWDAGSTKLSNDVLNGIYKPDIVIGYSNNGVISQLRDRGMFTDLSTYIDSDPVVNRENIFSGILDSFTTDDGKVWGLCRNFYMDYLIGTEQYLGDRTSWTTEEMLDFALSLPEGVSLFEDLTQSIAAYYIFGTSGYSSFIDSETNTCSFDSPLFIKYLEYVKTLPEEIDYENRPDDYYETRYLKYHNGEIALSRESISDLADYPMLAGVFGTEDYVMIGSPVDSEDDYPSQFSDMYTIMVTSDCEYPAEAWDLITDIIAPEFDDNRGRYFHGLPILKTMFDRQAEEYLSYEYEIWYSGGMSWGPADPENPKTTEDMTEPGIIAHFTEEDAAFLKDYIDKNVGFSSSAAIATEINSIVTEEISSFTSGVKSAEECAKVIQSRVSIWLSEHE